MKISNTIRSEARSKALRGLSIAAATLGTWLIPTQSHAEIILSLLNDTTYGLKARSPAGKKAEFVGNQDSISLRMDTINARMSYNASSVFIGYSFTAGPSSPDDPGNSVATFHGDPDKAVQNPDFDLRLLIQGTAGEAVGTPVVMTLSNSLFSTFEPLTLVDSYVNDTRYDSKGDFGISGFKIGDTVRFWALMDAPSDYTAQFRTTLTVAPLVGSVAAAPEPSSAASLTVAGTVAGLTLTRRRRGRP